METHRQFNVILNVRVFSRIQLVTNNITDLERDNKCVRVCVCVCGRAGGYGCDLSGSELSSVVGPKVHGNEQPGSTKGRKFLYLLSKYIFNKHLALFIVSCIFAML